MPKIGNKKRGGGRGKDKEEVSSLTIEPNKKPRGGRNADKISQPIIHDDVAIPVPPTNMAENKNVDDSTLPSNAALPPVVNDQLCEGTVSSLNADEMEEPPPVITNTTVDPPLQVNKTTNDDDAVVDFEYYDLPFTVFQRFIPSSPYWNIDSTPSNSHTTFFASGERRKKEVKDDFDWLQPTLPAADLSAAKEVHALKYNFNNGISTKDPKSSTSKSNVPLSVSDRITNFDTYPVAMKHQLCFNEQSVNWLVKPVTNLLDRIRSSEKRTYTRSSLHDAHVGKDLLLFAAHCNANDFVCSSDDVELIDLVSHDFAKKIWHCSNVMKSEMLRKAIIAAYTASIQNDEMYGTPEWLSLLNSPRSKASTSSQIQFLGLVSLYESRSGNKVNAFLMHSFVLYSWNPRWKSTVVHLLLTEQRVTLTSAQERILQILQMIQADHNDSTELMLAPEFNVSIDTKNSLLSLGFSMETSPKNKAFQVFTRQSVVKISKFTNRVMWGRYGLYLLHSNVVMDGFDAIVQLQCRLVAELLLRPLNPTTAIGIRFTKQDIHHQLTLSLGKNIDTKNDLAHYARIIREVATRMTRIPMAVLTHSTVLRLVTHGGQLGRTYYETTLELLQYVSVALTEVQPLHDSFAGDCNTCVLFCEKCHRQFGREGNIFQVLSEASQSILYHHGLELIDVDTDDSLNDDLEEYLQEKRFKKSLPMHAMSIGMGASYSSLITSLNEMKSQRCKFGIGENLPRDQHAKNHHYMHNLDEAMRIDAFLAGNEEFMNKRSCFTMALLFSIFDVVSNPTLTNKKNEGTKTTDDIKSFDNYATSIDDAVQSGEKWILSTNQDSSSTNHLRIIVGWCTILCQQFLLNFCHLSKCVINMYGGSTSFPFSVEDLLSKIGLHNRRPELLIRCQKYNMNIESMKNFDFKIIDKICSVPLATCLHSRPMLDRIEEKVDEIGIISKLGSGWNTQLTKTWFVGKKQEEQTPDRKISSDDEAQESIIIMKTASSVTLEYENDEMGRGYQLTCNVEDIIRHNPNVLTGPNKSLYSQPTFACSNAIITSLPFQFVKNLRVGKPQNIPKAWKSLAHKNAMRAESGIMTSIQLWRHISCPDESDKFLKKRIYRAMYESVSRGKISNTTALIGDIEATRHIRSEPWILDRLAKLCSVRNYDTIEFGEGAKSSRVENVSSSSNLSTNFWYSSDNYGKLCTEGAVANMLYHMNMAQDASEFKQLSTINETELLRALQQSHVPKRVIDKGRGMNPLEKCMWILEKKFNCQRFGYLNTDHFKTSEMIVEHMTHIHLPVLLSVVGHQSVYSHVVVLWRGTIIDFEAQAPYPLTVANVKYICGSKNMFHYVRSGYVIIPSKKMKVAINDFTDWGGKELKEKYSHLFRNKP